MTTLKEDYQNFINTINKGTALEIIDEEGADIFDLLDSNSTYLQDKDNSNVYYELSNVAGWAFYDTCLRVEKVDKKIKATIGYYNDQTNELTPVFEFGKTDNEQYYLYEFYEAISNLDYTSSDQTSINIAK